MKNKVLKNLGIVLMTVSMLSFAACNNLTPTTQMPSSTSEEPSEVVVTVEKDSEKKSETVSEETSEEALEDTIDVDYQFISKDKNNLKMGFPQEIQKDGKTYVYTGMADYKVQEELEVVEATMEVAVEDQSDLDKQISYKSKITGNTYLLSADGAYIQWGELKKIPKKVTHTEEWGPRMESVDIPNVKAITYFNKYTNQEETVSGTLVSKRASEPFWSAAEEPITGTFARSAQFDSYKTQLIMPDGNPFAVNCDMKGAYPSWEGYQQDILKILGLDPNQYRVTGAGWSGDTYWGVENLPSYGADVAVEYRDAIYPYEALCRSYTATYEAEGESLGYQTDVTYYATVESLTQKKFTKEQIKQDIEKIYKVLVTAKYAEKK